MNKNEMKINEVINYLDRQFHPEWQEDYDNSGFLLGDADEEYRGALVALDLTDTVVDEALEHGLNLIVTHHPFIFGSVKRITASNAEGKLIIKLISRHISVYAAHTNLDNMPEGVSGILADKLGLSACRILGPKNDNPAIGGGMVGDLPEAMTKTAFLLKVKTLTGQPMIRHAGGPDKVRRIALCGGSGSFLIDEAIAAGADIYLTADIKYHDFQRATECTALADIGHFESEQFAKEIIYSAILKKFSNFACRITERQGSLVSYI